ncbi:MULTISPECIES: hypothetical protein [unclassified Aureimonas]|uniref:hypothetical protein n=1 Tax=unclassified Aureimonas TaxID=2615206 RepID=UPI0012E34C4C|nr:hypothetical protein [Aureimonas sp. Leaf427]
MDIIDLFARRIVGWVARDRLHITSASRISGQTAVADPRPHQAQHHHGLQLVTEQVLDAMTIPSILRDSLDLLAVVLERETELQSTEIATDTA